jgi:transposase-like protein
MDEKIKFIAMATSGAYSFAATCRQFGISRQTGYELMARYNAEGERALAARSRAPHTHPNAINEAMAVRQCLDRHASRPMKEMTELIYQLPASGGSGPGMA